MHVGLGSGFLAMAMAPFAQILHSEFVPLEMQLLLAAATATAVAATAAALHQHGPRLQPQPPAFEALCATVNAGCLIYVMLTNALAHSDDRDALARLRRAVQLR